MTDLPHVNDFDVVVEQQDAGWAVITVADGVRSVVAHHPDEESAVFAADQARKAATRHEDAIPAVAPRPEKYPGDGETA